MVVLDTCMYAFDSMDIVSDKILFTYTPSYLTNSKKIRRQQRNCILTWLNILCLMRFILRINNHYQ